jgi:hypothetical protein
MQLDGLPLALCLAVPAGSFVMQIQGRIQF